MQVHVYQYISSIVLAKVYLQFGKFSLLKKFCSLLNTTKIKHVKNFQHTYCVIEHEFNNRRPQKIFDTNILDTKIS